MGSESSGQEVQSLSDYLRVLRRGKWVVLAAVLLFPLASVAYSLNQQPLYKATAEVLLSRNTIVANLTGTPDPVNQQPDRIAQTQAGIASVPIVAERVLKEAGIEDMTAEEFLDRSNVSVKPEADILVFAVTDPSRTRAVELATEYAR